MKNLKLKTMYSCLIAATLMLSTAETASAQGFKGKLKGSVSSMKGKSKKGGKKGGGKFASFNAIDDATGVSGAYTSIDAEAVRINGYNKKVNQFGAKFIKEKDGKIINKMELYYSKTDYLQYYLKENVWLKYKVRLFVLKSNSYMEAILIDTGVIAFTSAKHGDWSVPRVIENVLAKDPAKLEVYDKETAKVKVDQIMNQLNAEALKKKKATMLTYKAYKEYEGKLACASRLNHFIYNRTDKPSEDPKNFTKKLTIGKDFYFRGYLAQPLAVSHPGAWFNISYEFVGQGVKTDREALRSTTSFFSKNIPRKTSYTGNYCTWVHAGIEKRGNLNVWDYAYVEALSQMKDKFKVGKSYQLKITLHAHLDGENIADLATTTVTMDYTQESDKLLNSNDANKPGILPTFQKYKDQ
jgi:hypothetical protein